MGGGGAERIEFVSAVLLLSRDPERLAAFYRDALGLPLAKERHGASRPHFGCELGDIHFAIHPADEAGSTGTGAVKLAFFVFDLDGLVRSLEEHGVDLLYPPRQLGDADSRITAVRDPDGNEIEFSQLGDGWLRHLDQRRAEGHDLLTRWKSR
jgi:catechol 2,3-dioxygenase-like lactoylglutathione lyase family enzyme